MNLLWKSMIIVFLFLVGTALLFISHAERGDNYAAAGFNLGGTPFWLLLAASVGYYIVCEAATGATLGKRIVGIRVVGEDGEHITFGAAVVRNLLRFIDGLFFYLVGFLSALLSTRGQRLGDRAAHTIAVRR